MRGGVTRYFSRALQLERKEAVREICETINKRNHASQLASRGSNLDEGLLSVCLPHPRLYGASL